MHTLHLELSPLLFLLLFPIQALAQAPEAPSPVTQDGYTIVEYYNFDFTSKDWFYNFCPFKVCDCFKCQAALIGPPMVVKDGNGKPVPIKRNHSRAYLDIKARCSSDFSHCEEIDEPHHTIEDASNVLFNHRDKNGGSHWYSYKKDGNKPEMDLTGIINQNKRRGVKHPYAVKTRSVNAALTSSEDAHDYTFSVKKMCNAKYDKKTKAYQITDDCECFAAKGFSSTDYLITLVDPNRTYGYSFPCEYFDDDQRIIKNDITSDRYLRLTEEK